MKTKFWSRLQVRMTLSFVAVTVMIVLLLEIMVSAFFYLAVTRSPALSLLAGYRAEQAAQIYALEASILANQTALDPNTTFHPGLASSLSAPGMDSASNNPFRSILAIPYQDGAAPAPALAMVGLLVTPDGRVLSSSDPRRYLASAPASQLLPDDAGLIQAALAGHPGSAVEVIDQGKVATAAEPVWNREKQTLGAILVLSPASINSVALRNEIIGSWFRSWAGWLLLMLPFGAVFGAFTTRGLVNRVQRLVSATGKFAGGDFSQRVAYGRKDEIGQLEQQFNQMAEQLVESMATQKRLAEQNARLEERARIEQDMQTARYIQQSLLPTELPDLPGWHLEPFYRPAREVGGDLYDFLALPGGRLGIVIGDVTGKGIPAALVMATTCTMLRASTAELDSPGEVLARVNNVLHAHIPSSMFVTCFYAVLDPASGQLRYANAGHNLPYCLRSGEIRELHASGMPLGLMPEMSYFEDQVFLDENECVLFYTDGLVEAHNPENEMFGLPRLKTLMQGHTNGTTLIEYLLDELQNFTGRNWEQEDDVTLLTLQKMPGGMK